MTPLFLLFVLIKKLKWRCHIVLSMCPLCKDVLSSWGTLHAHVFFPALPSAILLLAPPARPSSQCPPCPTKSWEREPSRGQGWWWLCTQEHVLSLWVRLGDSCPATTHWEHRCCRYPWSINPRICPLWCPQSQVFGEKGAEDLQGWADLPRLCQPMRYNQSTRDKRERGLAWHRHE